MTSHGSDITQIKPRRSIIRVSCVRADGGKYTEHFIHGGYIGTGWEDLLDLRNVQSRDELSDLVQNAYPGQPSPIIIGNAVGQIARFLLDIPTSSAHRPRNTKQRSTVPEGAQTKKIDSRPVQGGLPCLCEE